jgi:predicted  nucleic acid-binding Zn-ribbon protein
LKARIHSLTSECTLITDQLHQSEQEKRELIERITQLERQRRDDNDALQNEVNHYRKLVEKSTHAEHRFMPTNVFSPLEHDLSLYEEVRLELPVYQPTNYQALFAPLYEKLKSNLA